MPRKPETIDEYLSRLDPERYATLQKLRQTIHSLLPGVVECISYSMPAFRFNGKVVAGFLATKEGCSYYPFSGTTLATLANELVAYSQTKSALHFDAQRPPPRTILRKLLRARIAETEQVKKTSAKAPSRTATSGSKRAHH